MSNNDVELLWVAKSDFPLGQRIKSHAHKGFYHIFYGVSGTIDFIVDDVSYVLAPDRVILACPDQVHEMKPIKGERLVAYELKFVIYKSELRQTLTGLGVQFDVDERVRELVFAILQEAESGKPGFREIIRNLFYTVLLYMTRNTFNDSVLERKDTVLSQPTMKVLHFINDHYQNKILLADIAMETGYNSNYICTLFKNETGVSISKYMNMLRIRKAVKLIYFSDMDIARVVEQCGFTNPYHFSRTFKHYTGITPIQCRQLFYTDVIDMDHYGLGEGTFQTTVFPERFAYVEEILRRFSDV